MLSSRFSVTALAVVFTGFCAGCGGSEKPAESASETAPRHSTDRESSDAAASSNDAAATTAPQRATCDDGTCSPCGDALCPTGWYCDESAKGGPACGWLPECAPQSGCACVKKALGCACEEKSGAPHITCG